MLEFRILGTLEVADGGRSIDLRRAKPRAVLAMLVLQPNQTVSTDRLVHGLWGDAPPASAANTLQGYVSQLRQAIAPLAGDEDAPYIRTQPPRLLARRDIRPH
ncbi:MAG: winged helix-turn-helix domain-containing protein [Actinomycetota bacterium]|nr:winged helix-turn-helix domain-containing protein [Actinomycetota bacterium]